MTKQNCQGCHNDIYNHDAGGAKECWSFKTAKLILRREVHMDDLPPHKQKPNKFPDCYRKPHYFYMDPSR
jgi:hypothetical protein